VSEAKPENIQSWVEFLDGFDEARAHFAQAYRHTLLGTAETLRVFQQLAHDPRATPFGTAPVGSLLELIQRGLRILAEKVPALLEAASLDMAKREALITVKEVLLAEKQRATGEEKQTEAESAKLEALDAILRVIELELEQRESRETQPEPSLRRVVIE
jgi:hypothetical protein